MSLGDFPNWPLEQAGCRETLHWGAVALRNHFSTNGLAVFSRIATEPKCSLARGNWAYALARQEKRGAIYRPIFAQSSALRDASPPRAASGVRDERLARLEAVLFLAREPVSSRKLAQITSLADGTEARTLVRVLNSYYEQQASAFRIEEVAGGFQLFARPQFGSWLRRLFQSPVEVRLSAPALETLAVVAYRQPVLRADVEAIRGVQSGEILRQLMERDLVKIVGRSPELGRPFLYGVTKRFLRIFGLRHLEDLPRVAGLAPAAISPEIPLEAVPEGSGNLDTSTICQRHEESDVRMTATLSPRPQGVLDRPKNAWPKDAPPIPVAADEDIDDDDDDLDDDDDDDDLEDEEDSEDDLEEEEWEEVDDEEEDDLEEEEDDEDWEDDDEDDDWDDDEDDWDEDDEE